VEFGANIASLSNDFEEVLDSLRSQVRVQAHHDDSMVSGQPDFGRIRRQGRIVEEPWMLSNERLLGFDPGNEAARRALDTERNASALP